MSYSLILASQSPRRKELLAQLGYQFNCHPADIDESTKTNETPKQYVCRIAEQKTLAVTKHYDKQAFILGSDTAVIIKNTILGKPANKDEAKRMLSLLSGSTHQVLTAICVSHNDEIKTELVRTDVAFKELSAQEIDNYWCSKEPQDKAGAYGIQGLGGQFVKQIQGSYSAVVGLPLYETAKLLGEFGLKTPIQQEVKV